MTRTVSQRLLRWYWALQRRIAPGLRYAQREYEDALGVAMQCSVRWLDVGCGRRLFASWRADAEHRLVDGCRMVVGADADLASLRDNGTVPLRCQSLLSALPFRDESFDLITANMVLEHLEAPADGLREIGRLLSRHGVAILHTPNGWAVSTIVLRITPSIVKRAAARVLESRGAQDVFPTYYRANSPSAIRKLAERTGLEVESIRLISSRAIFALIPPLAAMELVWIRCLSVPRAAILRSNMIVSLRKRRVADDVVGESAGRRAAHPATAATPAFV